MLWHTKYMVFSERTIMDIEKEIEKVKENIHKHKLSIYDKIRNGHFECWHASEQSEYILNRTLKNLSLNDLPLRTRSKVVKEKICETLGYPLPKTFKKTHPRFIGQDFDTYIQKSNNLQIWNEDIAVNRRYVIMKVSSKNIIESVKVVTGDILAKLDTTGTLTQKYQATIRASDLQSELITNSDTDNILTLVHNTLIILDLTNNKPTEIPDINKIIPITFLFEKMKTLIGTSFEDTGKERERTRGDVLYKLVCRALGYKDYSDTGRFPDILHQLIEVKLQSSPTIDLGLVAPSSRAPLPIPAVNDIVIRHSDVRYLVFYAEINNNTVKLTNMYLTTGEKFFDRFPRFEGKVINKKLQIPLPKDFFIVASKE